MQHIEVAINLQPGLLPDVFEMEEMFNGCCSGLGPDESKTLAGLLAKLNTALNNREPMGGA